MFERRARIVLAVFVIGCLALLLRAGQLQVVQSDDWDAVAQDALRRSSFTEPARGRLLDRHGRVLAQDVPCNDAAVAYWFVKRPPDAGRLERLARDLARQTPGYYQAETAEQVRRVEAMKPEAERELDKLWDLLARVGGITREEIEQQRDVVVDRVEARRRHLVYSRWSRARDDHAEAGVGPWWRRWLLGEADAPPELADFEEPIAEEEQAHVLLPDLTAAQYNELLQLRSDLPPTLADALILRASSTRRYPYGPVAAHAIGRIAEVSAEDVADDPELGDELRRYLPGDLAGKEGLERAAERTLRGSRGRIDHDLDRGTRIVAHERVAGRDVTTTLDIELSADIRRAFTRVDFRWPKLHANEPEHERIEVSPMPGAAVVIEVDTGEVLASVSYPDYDPNRYDEDFDRLREDFLARRLVNRATGFAAEPGSTVKPLVGLGAVGDGLVEPHGTIECTGYLIVDMPSGRIRYSHTGRCWTAKMYGHFPWAQGHQTTPDPHPTAGLNPFEPPARFLTLADAVQRSCNVFFETLGHDGGGDRLSEWMGMFGLGRPTGVELPEKGGSLPRDITPAAAAADGGMGRIRNNWFGAIGQGFTQATPFQMANAAATLARDGVWQRPTLLGGDQDRPPVDLGLDPLALDMVHRGMNAVCHTHGGSGHRLDDRLPLRIGAKTGSAQAHLLTIKQRDDNGDPVTRDGRVLYQRVEDLSTRGSPNPLAPWYRRTNSPDSPKPEVTHAWFIGYAPAENPKYAFAVFVEYGGSGGVASGSVAAQIVQAMVKHGYLEPERELDPDAPEGVIRYKLD
jgi:penicillin-binding protein 2